MPKFSEEYYRATSHTNRRWRAIRSLSFGITLGRDTIAPWLKARDLDHLTYRHLGRELPFVDVVPLSRTTHRIVTIGRRIPFAKPFINFALRLSYALWIIAWTSLASECAWLAGAHIPHPSIAYIQHAAVSARATITTATKFATTGTTR